MCVCVCVCVSLTQSVHLPIPEPENVVDQLDRAKAELPMKPLTVEPSP